MTWQSSWTGRLCSLFWEPAPRWIPAFALPVRSARICTPTTSTIPASRTARPSRWLIKTNLGLVAQAIYNESDRSPTVRRIRLHEPVAWPVAEQIPEHFSVYRVLARLASKRRYRFAGEPDGLARG